MDKYDLFNSLNEVDDSTLLSTEQPRTNRIKYPVIKIIAACLALAICGLGIYCRFRPTDSNRNSTSWFVITAYAENGVKEEFHLNCSFANSYKSETNLFGNDKPVFSFDIHPKKVAEDQEAFSINDCDIFVSYNGKKLDYRGDDHIMIAYTMPAAGYPGSPGYTVFGQFDEPTTLIIGISDRHTGDLMEEYRIHVKPMPETENYELTVLEIKTYEQKK